MSALDDIRQRAEGVALWREHFMPPQSKIDFSQRDVPRLLGALDSVLALADKWAALGPADDWAEGGMADTVLADAGRAVRAAVNEALEADK